jgi:NAD(P)H-hydrate epimerase
MQKIFDANQIKALDQHTIQHEPIASIDLMERASRAFFDWFCLRFPNPQKIAVVCGTGNNGGDGLAIARMLANVEYHTKVFLVKGEMPVSENFSLNLARLHPKITQYEVRPNSNCELTGFDIVLDAIFGVGISRPASGVYAQAIQAINQSGATVVAVDVPSGLYLDKHACGSIVHAQYTATFQLPKLAFMFPENEKYVGEWSVVNIGLSRDFIRQTDCDHFLTNKKSVAQLLKTRHRFSHKGNYGHALLLAGSYGKMGACVLAARAAFRAGVGLLTVGVPKCGYAILQTSVPEAMAQVDTEETHLSHLADNKYQAVGVGPGIGKHPNTVEILQNLLTSFRQPMVLDADALTILAENKTMFEVLPQGTILTPHPKEFERLAGKWENDFERLEKQKQLSKKYKCVIVLKGANSSISTPHGKVFFNSTGNPGMATAGSGDVLTGILTALLAQGYQSTEAAVLGVYLHGLAGDLAAYDTGHDSLMASDIINYLPQAFRALKT